MICTATYCATAYVQLAVLENDIRTTIDYCRCSRVVVDRLAVEVQRIGFGHRQRRCKRHIVEQLDIGCTSSGDSLINRCELSNQRTALGIIRLSDGRHRDPEVVAINIRRSARHVDCAVVGKRHRAGASVVDDLDWLGNPGGVNVDHTVICKSRRRNAGLPVHIHRVVGVDRHPADAGNNTAGLKRNDSRRLTAKIQPCLILTPDHENGIRQGQIKLVIGVPVVPSNKRRIHIRIL